MQSIACSSEWFVLNPHISHSLRHMSSLREYIIPLFSQDKIKGGRPSGIAV